MCVTCIELHKIKDKGLKEKLEVIGEALKVAAPYPAKQKHLMSVYDKLMNQEVPMPESNEEADKDWWNHTHEED